MIQLQRYRPINVLEAGLELHSYDEWPALRSGMDPQVHLSRNTVTQPFWLVCDDDTVLAAVSGSGRVELRHSPVNSFTLRPGDHVYVPARTPHRIVPTDTLLQLRYKSSKPGAEAVAWFCERCGAEVSREEFDPSMQVPQRAWLAAVERFNANSGMRTCSCGTELLPVDLGDIRWAEVATAIESLADDSDDDRSVADDT